MTITLNDIWQSSTGLLKRFDLMPDIWTAQRKTTEEFFEMIEEFHNLSARPRNHVFQSDAMCELCDLVVTLINLGYAAGCSWADFEDIDLSDTWSRAALSELGLRDTWISLQSSLYRLDHSLRMLDASVERDDLPHHYGRLGRIIREVIYSAFCVAARAGLTYADFERSMESVMYKNAAKTHQTHEVRDGMIKKRKPTEEAQS